MKLPIDDHLNHITDQLLSHQNILVQSSPGSGKTTRIPPHLIKYFENILVVEPRRIAAIYAASRIAEENNWILGSEVGYEVRFDSKKNASTSILFLTEALLAKKIVADPNLNKTNLVIFDEFHERSYWSDLAIGHIKEMQILGAPIKMLFLSATIDQAPLASFFESIGVVKIDLPRFPIEVVYQRKPFRYHWGNELEANLISALLEVIHRGKHQILVFLPGLKEIRSAARAIEANVKFKGFNVEVLHGSVPLSTQKSIVANENNFEFRIILSTNIAESSLTISGVTAVIDSGLHRDAFYNSDYDETQLQTKKISQFSAIQRQGRANRLGPGVGYKMWMELDEKSMEKAPVPDIKKSSLFDLGLYLIGMGHWPLSQFTWFERPSPSVLSELENLYIKNNLCSQGKLTALGDLILDLGLTYENALLLILSKAYDSIETAALLIALIESEYSTSESVQSTKSTLLDSFEHVQRARNQPPEINKRVLQLIHGFSKTHFYKNWRIEFANLFQSSEEKTVIDSIEKNGKSPLLLPLIITFSYRSRLCKRRRQDGVLSHRAVTTKGKEVLIGDQQKSNLLPAIDYLINFKTIIDANQIARCFNYHFIEPEIFNTVIRPFCQKLSRIEFVETKQQFYKVTELLYNDLLIDTLTHDSLNPTELKEKTKDIFIQEKEALFFTIPLVEDFLNRSNILKSAMSVEISIEWEQLIDLEVTKGLNLKNRLEWELDIESYLSYENQNLMKTLVPKEIFPKGLNRSFRVHYSKTETPFIESRLQHFLGLNTHPTILNSQMKLKVVLLGPHGRPIQITNDLPGFWKTSYPEIRKEMKGRYPKHAWPEDPTSFSN